MADKKAEGFAHRDAVSMWVSSEVRANLLAAVPESEQKKRRFKK